MDIAFCNYFLFMLFLEILLLMISPLYWDFNNVLSDLLNIKTNFVLIIMLVFAVPLIYTEIFLVRY